MWRWRWTRWPDWTYQYHEACIPNQWWRLTTDQTNEYKYRIQHSPLSFSSHGTSLGSSLSQELPMWTGGYQNHCESRPSIYRPPTLRLTISAITDWWRCSDAQRVPLGGTYPYQEHTGERLEVWGDPGQWQVESERIHLLKIFHFSSLLSGSWWRRPTVCQRVGYLSLSPLVRKFTFSNRKISLRHHDAITRVFTSFLSVTMI